MGDEITDERNVKPFDYSEVDITCCSEDEIVLHFTKALYEARSNFLNDHRQILLFENQTLFTYKISREILANKDCPTEFLKVSQEDFLKYKQRLFSNNFYFDILREQNFLSFYQSFEGLIAEILMIILWFFPKFIIGDNLQKDDITIPLNFIFDNNNILLQRKVAIERKVKDLVQSNNIKTVIHKIGSLSGTKLDLPTTVSNNLIVISNDRNILIHNRGFVNNIYLSVLKLNSISSNYNHGEKIAITDEYMDESRNLMADLVKQIIVDIAKKASQIQTYYKSKYSE